MTEDHSFLSLARCGRSLHPRLGRLRSVLLLPQLLSAGLSKARPWQPAVSPPTDPILPRLRSRTAAVSAWKPPPAAHSWGRQSIQLFIHLLPPRSLYPHHQSQGLRASREFPRKRMHFLTENCIFTVSEYSEKGLI